MRKLQRTIRGTTRAPRVPTGATPASPVSLNNQKHQYIWIQQSKSARFFGPQFLCSSDGQPPAQKLWRARQIFMDLRFDLQGLWAMVMEQVFRTIHPHPSLSHWARVDVLPIFRRRTTNQAERSTAPCDSQDWGGRKIKDGGAATPPCPVQEIKGSRLARDKRHSFRGVTGRSD
jgi:hypothetical protein